jgi:hypothetical protein
MMPAASAPASRTDIRSRSAWRLDDDTFPLALVFVMLAAGTFILPAQNDTWWHLHSGRAMWETHSFLTTERFSFASQAQPLANHWWLTQLAFFGLYSLGGAKLLTLAAGVCVFVAVVGSFALLRGSVETRLLLLVLTILCTAPEWSIRPQVVSLLMLVTTAHVIVRNRIWWLPVVCLVWGNAHAMVIFGVVMAGALVAEALLFERARLRATLGVLVLCIAAPMVSPLGWHYWPNVLSTVSTSQALNLQEYRTPVELVDLPFWVLLIALVAISFRARRTLASLESGRRTLLIAAFVLAVAAISAARNVAFFAVLAAPSISSMLPAPQRRQTSSRAGWPAYVVLTAAIAGATAFVVLRWQDAGRALGWRPIEPAALQAVDRCRGNLFNTLEDGGPVMWALHDRPIFVDSRMEAYPEALLARSRNADLDGDYEGLFQQFDIRCALVPSGTALDARLRGDQSMRVDYSDPWRTVFEKK